MNKRLFGTSGVRGVVNQDLTQGLCKDVGRALGTILPAGSSVCLGTDSRLSREMVKNAVTDGLIDAGVNVAHLGIVPTPALALLTREIGFDAGVMITASHNPPEFNGIKLFNKDSIGFSRTQEEEIENVISQQTFRSSKTGAVETLMRARLRYMEFLKSLIKDFKFNFDLRLLVDPGNGAASGFASYIFESIGFKVIPFNDTPDGRFPGRNPEPKEDTLLETMRFLRQKNADLAICFDGDADRVVFCDQTGFIGFNEMISYISRQVVQMTGRKTVATTVETGLLLDLAIADLGGNVVRGRVGDVYAAHLARENNAALGVEPVGVYIIPEAGYYPDSIYASLLLLSSFTNVAEIRQFFRTLPPLYFSKDKVTCPNDIKADVMEKVRQKAVHLKPVEVNDLDGLRLEFGGAWMLIRASGTEPAIRVMAESKGQVYTRDLLSSGMAVVHDSIKEVSA
jgi:phosphoglucosamine mutase